MTPLFRTFEVRAAIDPQTLPRVVGQLARRWITPISLTSERVGEEFLIRIVTDDLTNEAAEIVAATLRSNVLVHGVELRMNDAARS